MPSDTPRTERAHETARTSFAALVTNALRRNGVSQNELARRAGMTPSAVSRMLDPGDDRSPTLRTMVRVAGALNMKLTIRME